MFYCKFLNKAKKDNMIKICDSLFEASCTEGHLQIYRIHAGSLRKLYLLRKHIHLQLRTYVLFPLFSAGKPAVTHYFTTFTRPLN